MSNLGEPVRDFYRRQGAQQNYIQILNAISDELERACKTDHTDLLAGLIRAQSIIKLTQKAQNETTN